MKHFLLIAFITCCGLAPAFGQWTVQPSVIISEGYNSYILKPAPMLEVSYKTPDEDAFYKIGFTFGFSILRPTADTFRTYATGYQFLPGSEVLHSYSIFAAGVTNDFIILHHKKLSPVIGVDIYFYSISIAEHNYAKGLMDETTTGDNYWQVAICPRIGISYRVSQNFLISAGCGRNTSIMGTSDALPFLKPYISVSFL